MSLADRPAARLTRHFFSGLFDWGVLSEAAALSFTRLVIGICALFFSFGLLLLRIFAEKYRAFAEQTTPDGYRHAVLGDHAFLIAVPMWIVAFVTVLIGHALFPDEIDFRVLTALPITRRLIFGAKLAAVALFTGLFIASAQAALSPLAILTLLSRWAEGAFVHRAAAFALASGAGSAFAVLAIAAIQGLLLLCAAAGRLAAASAALRSLMLFSLMLTLPLVFQLPATSDGIAAGSGWVYASPPVWFLGLERWLAGDTSVVALHLAATAGLAWGIAAAAAAGSYGWLYLHFDRVAIRPVTSETRALMAAWWIEWSSRPPKRPLAAAIGAFTSKTLRRSGLHQGILVILTGIGAGLASNSLLVSGVWTWLGGGHAAPRRLVDAMLWAPFALMYVAARAARASLLMPIEPRANWVFRMTERSAGRADQLSAVAQTVTTLGVGIPLALFLPLQMAALGPAALLAAATSAIYGWLYVELLLKDWGRLPFTCSFIPGKGFVPQAVLKGAFSFVLFAVLGAGLARASVAQWTAAWVIDLLMIGAAVWLRSRRRQLWREAPLEFEDVLPNDVNPLKLSPD